MSKTGASRIYVADPCSDLGPGPPSKFWIERRLWIYHILFVSQPYNLGVQGEAYVFGRFCEAVLRSLGDLEKK